MCKLHLVFEFLHIFIMCGQVIAILGAASLAYYTYYYFDNFHYHVSRGYAHLGFPEAQHVVGQKLLHGECFMLHYYSYMYIDFVLTSLILFLLFHCTMWC